MNLKDYLNKIHDDEEKSTALKAAVKAGKDKEVFARTAKKSKKINVDPKNYRGGIRL